MPPFAQIVDPVKFPIGVGGTCGRQHGGTRCLPGFCCSINGHCGLDENYCFTQNGCQADCLDPPEFYERKDSFYSVTISVSDDHPTTHQMLNGSRFVTGAALFTFAVVLIIAYRIARRLQVKHAGSILLTRQPQNIRMPPVAVIPQEMDGKRSRTPTRASFVGGGERISSCGGGGRRVAGSDGDDRFRTLARASRS